MPIKYKTKTVKQLVAHSFECNCCKKVYSFKDDIFETQEYLNVRWCGGYGSVFGDGVPYDLTLCQHCLLKLVGEYFIEETDDSI